MSETTIVENNQITEAPVANPTDALANLAVKVEPVVPYTQPSDPLAAPHEQHIYEQLAAATTDEEKLKILESNEKKPEVKVGSFMDILLNAKVESKEKIEALHKTLEEQLNPELPVAEPTEDVKPTEEYALSEDETVEIVRDYEDLKEYKVQNELEKKVKDNFIAQLTDQNAKLSQELMDYQTSSVKLSDSVESSFISAKRAVETDPSDSNKYYYLYTLDKVLASYGITIKPEIDQVFGQRLSKGAPQVNTTKKEPQQNLSSKLARLGMKK